MTQFDRKHSLARRRLLACATRARGRSVYTWRLDRHTRPCHRAEVAGGARSAVRRRQQARGGGSIGATEVARSAPDGYTLLMGHIGTLAVNPSICPNLRYDPVTSFAPVAMIAIVPNVLVVNPALPARSVEELVALAKAKPGSLRYASGGNGGAAHIAMEYFKLRTGTVIEHIPYRGTAPAVADVMGGPVEIIMTGVPAVMQQVKAGRLRGLAVSGLQPVAGMPDLPTIAASGVPGFEAVQWYGIVAPAQTPPAVIARLNGEINRPLRCQR